MRRILIVLIALFLTASSNSGDPFIITQRDSFGAIRIKLNDYYWWNMTTEHLTIGKKGYFALDKPVRDSLLFDAKYRLDRYEKRIIISSHP